MFIFIIVIYKGFVMFIFIIVIYKGFSINIKLKPELVTKEGLI
jgi:hypothetical protein